MKLKNQSAARVLYCILSFLLTHTAIAQTANDRVPINSTPFQYGVNPGYYGNGWSDLDLAEIAAEAGSLSFRASLPGHFVEKWGYAIRVSEFTQYTQRLGMKGIAVFVGEPSENQIDKTIYPPATSSSAIFKNLYTPIWDNGENGTPVNDNNPFAVYVYNLVQTYGAMVEYWEIVNEPDYTSFWDNGNRSLSNNWYDNPPSPKDLPNLKAPVFYYIRMLRIAYDVIKRYQPDAYVTPGGLGHPAFLDALLRYTDNPDNGKVTSQYPLKGGAYFDLLSFHSYPANNLSVWDNSIGGRRWFRHSDAAAEEIFVLRDAFETVLKKHGYNGTQYPAKPYILTEVNIPRKMFGNHYGSDVAQRNFVIKASVESQKQGLQQFHLFKLGESAELGSAGSPYDAMGLYENLKRDKKGGQKLTEQGKALKTTSGLLYGWKYNREQTQQLQLPENIGGAAFKRGDQYRYVLWAKTKTDMSETAQGVYSFPPSIGIDSVIRYEWNYSVSSSAQSRARAQNISLTGTPSFFEESGKIRGPLPVNVLLFNASSQSCSVDMEWHVAFDEPDHRIIIEESANDAPFRTIYSAKLTAANATGTFRVDAENSDTRIYRLLIEGKNGLKTYSEARRVSVHCNLNDHRLTLYPNPANDALIVSGLTPGQQVYLYDNSGRKMKSLVADSKQVRVSLAGFSSGVYYLRIKALNDPGVTTVKVMKN